MPETIAERLRRGDRPTFSFEFFPPKDAEALAQLRATVAKLEPVHPDWVSITYGATGSTRDRTFEAVRTLRESSPAMVMGHLTVVGQTRAEVERAVASYAGLGVTHVLALRGDPPAGTGPFVRHPDGLATATELVRLVRAAGDFTVGVAAFPDGHPDRFDLDLDARVLLAKEEAGASFAVTQLFFSAEAYHALVARFRALGGTMPIVAGIMPVTHIGQIDRFAALSGAAMPEPFVARLRAAADDRERFREVGLDLMTGLCDELLAAGAPGLQFFTLNRSTATTEILARLRTIPPHRP